MPSKTSSRPSSFSRGLLLVQLLCSQCLCLCVSPGVEKVSRSGMRQLWERLRQIVEGAVHANLQICEIVDPTHPVRFATPPEEACYTVVYVGPRRISETRTKRVVFGEYTGIVKQGNRVNRQ